MISNTLIKYDITRYEHVARLIEDMVIWSCIAQKYTLLWLRLKFATAVNQDTPRHRSFSPTGWPKNTKETDILSTPSEHFCWDLARMATRWGQISREDGHSGCLSPITVCQPWVAKQGPRVFHHGVDGTFSKPILHGRIWGSEFEDNPMFGTIVDPLWSHEGMISLHTPYFSPCLRLSQLPPPVKSSHSRLVRFVCKELSILVSSPTIHKDHHICLPAYRCSVRQSP